MAVIRRRKMLRRKTSLRAKVVNPRKTRPCRQADDFARIYGSRERATWVRSQNCIVPFCFQPPENAHIRTDGVGRKADARYIVPLCAGHHRLRKNSLHALGRRLFEDHHRVDLAYEAAETERDWLDLAPEDNRPRSRNSHE